MSDTRLGDSIDTVSGPAHFRQLGGWLEQPADLQPPLKGNVSADVIVVGAGFAGLSTALELTALGAKVVVLEQEFAGFGASGRNAGYLVGGQGMKFDLFVKRIGHEKARDIVKFYDDGVSYVERRLKELGIDCDYNASGTIRAGVHPSQEKMIRQSMQLGLELGSPAQFLDNAAMRARGIPPAFLFGCHFPTGGTLNPGKYVLGLRRAAIQAGVRLYERTPLLSYSEGPVVTCHTAQGSASARHVVFATNAYTPQLGLLRNKVMPIKVSAIETEPLSAAQLESLGWPNREGITTSHLAMESHRLTAHNTLVLSTKRISYVYGSKTPNEPDGAAYRSLAEGLNARFPSLHGLRIAHCWSGYISFAFDALPVVGESGPQQNILYTAGCSGHGVGTQSYIGRLLAERISGIEHPSLAALRHTTPSLLPEPLQWCAMTLALGAANRLDGFTNWRARKG
ncbi:FAD-dependent oxidoreductase [Pseudomonas chlororaphis subsp. aurantiaca]|uniref:NAD(P)/FAD-dependent oxidoreductase n=1 Tax=Pseudomonas chlororaphis TaxID=587753 RepID=UPI00050D647C|nr:FAD-dependent oxidoreductase [Pseudomonas chlororaphis]AIS12957.1 FAD-dependent oxidoreductase [Pseudomonas chlororaphis subsp. aurantiaca]